MPTTDLLKFSSNDLFWLFLFLSYSFGVQKTSTFIGSRGSLNFRSENIKQLRRQFAKAMIEWIRLLRFASDVSTRCRLKSVFHDNRRDSYS